MSSMASASMAGMVPVTNETDACLTRQTRDGRELFYDLKVIQQPERARACGSGAKSSADRRPVDPPPVVELRIYEGEEKKDVTFSYNANFFLFTTLEPARQIAHGRVPQSQTMAPVLTGAPVAGMVYLDRPSPAGYFIFPDLSVRHEGKYRLSFSLYEDAKEEKDEDFEPVEGSPTTKNTMAPRAHVHFRMVVKSIPFDVFSAKKFPGLTESTPLSRQVAEQGCRVRIRRDIRVRRRDKANEGYPNNGDDGRFPSSERYSTPQHMPERPRSISNGSVDAATPYLARRPSLAETGYYPPNNYQQASPSVPTTIATPFPPTHLAFGTSSNPTYLSSTFQKPTLQALPPPSAPQQYTQPSGSSQYPSPYHSRQSSAPNAYAYQSAQPPQTSYGHPEAYREEYPPAASPRRASVGMSLNHEPRSMGFAEPYVQNPSMLPQHGLVNQDKDMRFTTSRDGRSLTPIHTNAQTHSNTLPPLTSMLRNDPLHSSMPSTSSLGPPPVHGGSGIDLSSYAQGSANTSDPVSARHSTPLSSSSKRPYGSAFNVSYLGTRQHNGMRPNADFHSLDVQKLETDDGEQVDLYDTTSNDLVYKRADGTIQSKKCQPRSPPRHLYQPRA